MPVLKVVFCVLLVVTAIRSQCTVSVPNITSSPDDLCAVVSQESLTYSCTNVNNALTWVSSVWSGPFIVLATETASPPSLNVDGVTLMESDNNNGTCISSTITFSGSLSALLQLNGSNLTCRQGSDQDDTVILLPFISESPELTTMSTLSATCGSTGNSVTLQWTPPTNTGGQGVMITHYVLTGLPQSASCSPGPCDMITSTTTTITGLQCNTTYNVAVSAANCRGVGNASDSVMITVDELEPLAPSFTEEAPCFDGNNIKVLLNSYTNSCLPDAMFVISSNCSANVQVVLDTPTVIMHPVSTTDYCEVTALVRSDCGDSLNTTIMVNGTCPPPLMPSSTPTSPASTSASSLPASTSIIIAPTIPAPTTMPLDITIPAAGGVIAGIVIAALVIILIIFSVCICCPPPFCMSCRRKCCCCCSEEMICCRCGADDEYGEPTAHVEKQPVLQSYSTETKEKDKETGQPSYPSGAMYQDPSTIQRAPAPTGDLYAQPDKPARHQKKPPATVEMATYQDPSTIQRAPAPTGELYAQPDKPPRQPSGPAPLYSEVNKSNPPGLVYADLAHTESPANARRHEHVPDTVYSEVRESRN